jgi:hypothetical protein
MITIHLLLAVSGLPIMVPPSTQMVPNPYVQPPSIPTESNKVADAVVAVTRNVGKTVGQVSSDIVDKAGMAVDAVSKRVGTTVNTVSEGIVNTATAVKNAPKIISNRINTVYDSFPEYAQRSVILLIMGAAMSILGRSIEHVAGILFDLDAYNPNEHKGPRLLLKGVDPMVRPYPVDIINAFLAVGSARAARSRLGQKKQQKVDEQRVLGSEARMPSEMPLKLPVQQAPMDRIPQRPVEIPIPHMVVTPRIPIIA